MASTGTTRRRRHVVLAEVVAQAEQSGELDAPWDDVPLVWQHFRDEGEILRELHQDWRTAFAGAVYVAIEQGEGDLQHDVLSAFRSLQRRYAGARRLLEHHAAHPAIAQAMRKERALLSSFSILSEGSPMRDEPRSEPGKARATQAA